ELDGARVKAFRPVAWRGQRIALAVDLLVSLCALDGVGIVCEQPLDPFVVEEPRTVDELVHHACGEVLRKLHRPRALSPGAATLLRDDVRGRRRPDLAGVRGRVGRLHAHERSPSTTMHGASMGTY